MFVPLFWYLWEGSDQGHARCFGADGAHGSAVTLQTNEPDKCNLMLVWYAPAARIRRAVTFACCRGAVCKSQE